MPDKVLRLLLNKEKFMQMMELRDLPIEEHEYSTRNRSNHLNGSFDGRFTAMVLWICKGHLFTKFLKSWKEQE